MSYYDESLFNTYQSLADVEGSFSTDWIPVIKEDFSEFNWMNFHTPNDSKEFFERPSSVMLFKLYRSNRLGSVSQLEKSLNKISEIRALINQYNND